MMLIVAGHLLTRPGQRDAVVARSAVSVRAARNAPGCLTFSVSADSVDPDRVCILEMWDNRAALDSFRAMGDDETNPFAGIASFHVREYEVAGNNQ